MCEDAVLNRSAEHRVRDTEANIYTTTRHSVSDISRSGTDVELYQTHYDLLSLPRVPTLSVS